MRNTNIYYNFANFAGLAIFTRSPFNNFKVLFLIKDSPGSIFYHGDVYIQFVCYYQSHFLHFFSSHS